ncbi:unnamed protein product [Symbiodinium microadriaticum]|nr:unnamed protein product [Symbiodinium microadriaticum]
MKRFRSCSLAVLAFLAFLKYAETDFSLHTASNLRRHVARADAANAVELSPVHTEFPRALVKAAYIDEEAVETACAALAVNVLKGNADQVEALIVVLKSMMPPEDGAAKVRGPPPFATLEKSELVWSEHDYMSGPQENLRILQSYEVSFSEEGFRDPKVLSGALDLAVAYLKNYAVDKADALYAATEPYCMERGLPWDVKWLQDCATLRCKQQRQPEAAVLLEEVAKRTPPHPVSMRDHEKAQEYFLAAQQVAGHEEPDKDDLWNMGIAKKHLGQYEEALPMLLKALEGWKAEEPDDDVTIAKLHDTVGSGMQLFERLNGILNPRRCSMPVDMLKHLIDWRKDAIHPTPIFELLGLALEDRGGVDPLELVRLEAPMEAQLTPSMAQGDEARQQSAARRRELARSLLGRAVPLVEETTRSGEADLSHISAIRLALITMELQVLDAQEHGISPETPISSLVPEWPEDLPGDMPGAPAEPLRLRHCFTHTGGFSNALPTVHPVRSLRPAELRRLRKRRSEAAKPPCNLKELVERESREPHIFAPGQHFNYCSVGSRLVARMVEEVSGLTIAEYIQKHICEPAGMTDTGFFIDESRAADCVSTDYHPWALPAVADGLFGCWNRCRLRCRSIYARLCGCAFIDDLKPAGTGVISPMKLWNRSSKLYHPDAGLVGTGSDFVRFLEVLTRDASQEPVLSPFVLEALASPVTEELQAPFALDSVSVGRLFPVRGDRLPRQKLLRPFNSFPGQRFSLGASVICEPKKVALPPRAAGTWHWMGFASTYFFVNPKEELAACFLTQLVSHRTYPILDELVKGVHDALL